MRISLLMEREPFPEILEKTLSQFWRQQFDEPVMVTWHPGRPADDDGQTWLVNKYLNAIFVPEVKETMFNPIKREFSRSPVWWKRPLQSSYVHMASSPQTAKWLAQASMTVSPGIANAETQMVIPGNHKIRWLNAHEGKVYGICKAGFHTQFMRQEIEARQQASTCGIPVPALLTVDEESYSWFCEEYISGTPINRLADKEQANETVRQVYKALTKLYAKTAVQIPISQYAAELKQQIVSLAENHHLLSEAEKTAVCQQIIPLVDSLSQISKPITLTLSHGDFQPANILLNNSDVWLIDWEYAAQRQDNYDAFVFQCAARFPDGLTQRLQQVIVNNWPLTWVDQDSGQTPASRNRAAQVFMLEECLFHLTQTNQPLFTKLGTGWPSFLQELEQWTAAELENTVD